MEYPDQIGDYIVSKRIAISSFGTVVLYTQESTQNSVIVKLFNKNHYTNAIDLTIASQIEGKHFPKFFQRLRGRRILLSSEQLDKETIPIEDMGYIQEYCGESLRTYLRGSKSRLTLDIVQQMFQALSDFHQHGFIHRDVKFDNFTIKDGVVYLIDYGLATSIEDSKEGNAGEIGTSYYMPISAHTGKAQTIYCDFESLGYILLEHFLGNKRWFERPPEYVLLKGAQEKTDFLKAQHSAKKIEKIRNFTVATLSEHADTCHIRDLLFNIFAD